MSFISMMSMEVVVVINSMAPWGSFYITVSWNYQVCSHLAYLLAFRTFYRSVLLRISIERFMNVNCRKNKTRCPTFRQWTFINLSICIPSWYIFRVYKNTYIDILRLLWNFIACFSKPLWNFIAYFSRPLWNFIACFSRPLWNFIASISKPSGPGIFN